MSGSSERTEENKASEPGSRLEGESESDINRARVEDEFEKDEEESDDAVGSGEKIMNFQDLKRLHYDLDLEGQTKKVDALALADKQSEEANEDVPPVKAAKEKTAPAKHDDDKAYESGSYAFTNSQLEESSSAKGSQDIANTAKHLQDKAESIAHEPKPEPKRDEDAPSKSIEVEKKAETRKESSAPKSRPDAKAEPVSVGDTYSYEDDFEQSSIPATSRDKDSGHVAKERVDEQPDEESNSSHSQSHSQAKPMYWADL